MSDAEGRGCTVFSPPFGPVARYCFGWWSAGGPAEGYWSSPFSGLPWIWLVPLWALCGRPKESELIPLGLGVLRRCWLLDGARRGRPGPGAEPSGVLRRLDLARMGLGLLCAVSPCSAEPPEVEPLAARPSGGGCVAHRPRWCRPTLGAGGGHCEVVPVRGGSPVARGCVAQCFVSPTGYRPQ